MESQQGKRGVIEETEMATEAVEVKGEEGLAEEEVEIEFRESN